MKKMIVFVLASLSLNAFADRAADTTQAARTALKTLMNRNPMVQPGEMSPKKANELIADFMVSSFNSEGKGALSVIENGCEAAGQVLKCSLTINNSDREINAQGAYAPADGMTESSLLINYTTDLKGKRLIGKVTALIAG